MNDSGTMIAVVLISTALLALGMVLAVVWGRLDLREPDPRPPATTRGQAVRDALRRYLWWVNVTTIAAVISGALVGTGGGRLIMRILALAAPASAQGQMTDAQEIVGRATLTGFLPLFVFGGLAAGFLGAWVYGLARRWFPSGWWAGPVLGLFLLVVFSAVMDPLRPDNSDFRILGPNWLAVVLYSALAIVHGSLVVAVTRWATHRVPELSARSLPAYLPLLVVVVIYPLGVVLALVALIVAVATLAMPRGKQLAVPRWAGRGALVLVTVLSLPFFIGSMATILAMG